MKIRKLLLAPRALAILVVSGALVLPCAAEAVSIGEIVLHSRLGEPLRAQVDLDSGSGEHIDESCLSLAAPDPREEDTSGYLLKANLALKTDGKRQYVLITSRKPFNDAFAKLRLQVKCLGSGSVIKLLTVLPDLDASAQPAIAAPEAPAETVKITFSPQSEAHAPAATRTSIVSAQAEVRKPSQGKAARPAAKRQQSAPPVSRKHEPATAFHLKLSGERLDESRIGKISAEERAALLARQKLLDADDQTASFLALQHQVKQLQDELGDIRAQLIKAGISPAAAASAATATAASATAAAVPTIATASMPATSAAAPAPAIRPQPAAAKQPPAQQDALNLKNGLFAAAALALAALALWLGLRYYNKLKSRPRSRPQPDTAVTPKAPASATAPAIKMVSPAVAQPPLPDAAPGPFAAAVVTSPKSEAAALAPEKIEEELSEEDSMLEEAGLYATHGRPVKAIEILQEVIKRTPSKAEAWPLLLSIYSSLGKAAEFEKTAREFLKHHKGNPAWSGIQALGRTLDQNNLLYRDDNAPIPDGPLLPNTATQRRPIGDILMEMGVLSKQDLQNCLDDFDPKQHGRFGGYLVARKVITLAQLDQALLQQQGVVTTPKPSALPSLEDMENFLADFDPKRDGSVSEFLASRNAATPERLSQLLQQQPAPSAPPAEEPPPAIDKDTALDFVLESTGKHSVLDLEFEQTPIAAVKEEKPAEAAAEPITLDFPKITLDLEFDRPSAKTADEK